MQKTTILLVEDNPADIRLMKELLKDISVDTELYVTMEGADALDFLNRSKYDSDAVLPDMVFLDLNLPSMQGIDVLKSIKSNPFLKCVSVVIMTSSCSPLDIQETSDNRADCYVSKPLDIHELDEVVRTINTIRQIKSYSSHVI